jgi:hypothetical protein
VQFAYQPANLAAHLKVREINLRPRRLVGIEFYIYKHFGRRREHGLAVVHAKRLDRAVVDVLAQPDKCLPGRGEVGESKTSIRGADTGRWRHA